MAIKAENIEQVENEIIGIANVIAQSDGINFPEWSEDSKIESMADALSVLMDFHIGDFSFGTEVLYDYLDHKLNPPKQKKSLSGFLSYIGQYFN